MEAELLRSLLPGGVGNVVGRAFALMDIAEHEIADYGHRYPGFRLQIHQMFGKLCPPPGMSQLVDAVYRSHVRELLRRVMAKAPLAPGTDAECLVAMSEQSYRHPFGNLGLAATERLMSRVVPTWKPPAQFAPESFPGEVEELLSQLRQKLTKDR